MAKLKFKNGKVEDYTLVLCTRDYTKLGQISGVTGLQCIENDASANELSFTVSRHDFVEINGNKPSNLKTYLQIKNALWEQIVDFKLVWVKERDEYFEIKVTTNDSLETSKTISGMSLCEAELSQYLLTAEINTEDDIARDAYEITTFYNPENPNASLLNRVFSVAPGYTIKHVDSSLMNLQRMFSLSDVYLYDFLIGECSEQFNCVFKFDSTDRSVSVYDLYSTCNKCGKRGDFVDECPECGSTDIKHYGEDTTIYVDKDNLTDSISVEIDKDNVKNCFKLTAGDEEMTATIRMLNPNGSNYIYHIPDYLKNDMSDGLVKLLDEYDILYNSYKDKYETLVEEIYQLIDDILYLESGMMPTIENAEVTASTEAEKLTVINLNPLGLRPTTVSKSTSLATVNSALKNYAKVYVKSGYVKLEIEDGATFKYIGVDNDGWNYGTWAGRFKVTNYSDEEDIAYSEQLTITVTDNYEEFVSQKVLKALNEDDDENSVFDVLAIDELEDFKQALTLYGLNRLTFFHDAIQAALDILISLDQADEYADLYEVLYIPYYEKLLACESELDVRQTEIDALNTQLEEKNTACEKIQSELNFDDFLGGYYTEFSSYRRESVYSNDNFISDDLDNAAKIKRAKEFIELAKDELYKSAEQQITITSTLYNLLAMKEFQRLVDKFETGNWIRIRVDGILYKVRLLSYSIDFDNLQTINVTFSNATKTYNPKTERESIINSMQAIGSTYGYVSQQASQGQLAQETLSSFYKSGINSAYTRIINNNKEEVTLTKQGLLCREWDDVTESYLPEQFMATHNILAFTSDNWETATAALGKHDYTYYDSANGFVSATGYGLTCQFVQANSVLSAPQIIGGEIISTNYSKSNGTGSCISMDNGTFNLGGGKFVLDDKNLTLNNGAIIGGTLLIGNKSGTYAEITTDGVLNCAGANVTGNITTDNITAIGGTLAGWNINSSRLYKENTSSGLYVALCSPSELGTVGNGNADVLVCRTGANSSNYSYPLVISSDGTFTATKATITGTITATGGVIGGCTIENGALKIGNANIGEKLTANSIDATNLKVSAANITGELTASQINTTGLIAENISGTTITGKTISGGTITGATISGNNITGGTINCSSATISGTLSAGTGSSIGSWKVDSNSIYSGSWTSSTDRVFMCTGTSGSYTIGDSTQSGWVFGAGSTFGVTKSGSLYCTSGKIGGWTITSSYLGGSNMRLYPNGKSYNVSSNASNIFYLVVYSNGVAIGGISTSGWQAIV